MGLTSKPITVALNMPFWRRSARFTLGASAALLLSVPSAMSAEILPEPHDDFASDTPAPRPSTTLPAPPARLPDIIPPRLTAGNGVLPAVPLFPGRRAPQFSAAFGLEESAAPRGGGFSARLMSRMSHEARRYRRGKITQIWGGPRGGGEDELPSIAGGQPNAGGPPGGTPPPPPPP